jgi:uncharacterized membrane protein
LTTSHFSWRRWWQIAACAALVSISSYAMYPKSFIYFGVLHGVCVMLLLLWGLRLIVRQARVYVVLGLICMTLFAYPPVVLNAAPWTVFGLISQKPITEDYVPLLPWFALVCWGYALGLWLQKQPKNKGLNTAFNPKMLKPMRLLAKLGQYSLVYYMLHQPVLLGVLSLFNLGRFA